ncbi:hypothetical protein H0H87_011498 [Tephrocybe sp. NHM501043]|nr:hypothetical protein H0H87_011498 [Tephrocybe sp. NHM501043]
MFRIKFHMIIGGNKIWLTIRDAKQKMNLPAGVVTIYNSSGVAGDWKIAPTIWPVGGYVQKPQLAYHLTPDLGGDLWNLAPYVPSPIQFDFRKKWRWIGRRLDVASDTSSTKPFILDFSDVYVKIPDVVDTCRAFGWSKLVICGLDQLEGWFEEDD